MKKYPVLFFAFVMLSAMLFGQDKDQMPIDSKVRYGKLDNGLTYYIRHNAYPEQRACFYIVQKVGSMQEEDSQAGLAHFLEHMAFNGTKNYPGRKTMLDYLEKQGARFGKDVNAYTSFDETVYNLKDIPVTREGIVDSCMLILHDWSSFITLDNDEIDKERSIIKEEWRNRTGAQSRIWDKTLPVLFEGSKYADRMPIGKMDIVENFDYQTIKDYYHKWYRPDLQAIIIVGDVDVDTIEEKVKTMFADIPKPANPAERIYYPVVDNKEPIVSIATDKEKTSTEVMLFYKHDIVPLELRSTYDDYRRIIIHNFISQMLSARFTEISRKPDAPFTYAYAYKGQYFVSKTKDAWTLVAGAKEGKTDSTLYVLVQENERVKRHGFTQTELDRAKSWISKSYENSYNNRNTQQSVSYVDEYTRSFLQKEPIPGIEYEYEYIQRILPDISLVEVNNIVKGLSPDKNIVISINGIEKEGLVYPTESRLIDILNDVKSRDIATYSEDAIGDNLLSREPVAGEIIKEETDDRFDAVVWTLSNGARVVWKKTDFREDEIILNSISEWGIAFYPDDKLINAVLTAGVIDAGGYGNFSSTHLEKFMTGKSAGAGTYINQYTVGINGGSSISDMETMFRLLHLKFTETRRDDEAYAAYLEKLKNSLKNTEASPYTAYGDSIRFALYGDNPRVRRVIMDDLEDTDYDEMFRIYDECFSDIGSFVFTIVGTIDEPTLRSMVKKYIASLPVRPRKNASEQINQYRKGFYRVRFEKEMENPKASVFNFYIAEIKREWKKDVTFEVLKFILDMVYTDKIREELGGTYGVSTSYSMMRKPADHALLEITFETDADKAVELNNLVHHELEKIAEDGPKQDKFDKVKEQLVKAFEEHVKQNGYWNYVLNEAYVYNEDRYSDYLSVLDSITIEDVRDLSKQIREQGNMIEVIMLPKEK